MSNSIRKLLYTTSGSLRDAYEMVPIVPQTQLPTSHLLKCPKFKCWFIHVILKDKF